MKANFQKALKAVLVHEGGWSNHPADPGGATMRGVTQRVYDAYRAGKGQAKRSVREIDKAELADIYARQYWAACRCDDLPSGVDSVVFDQAVNSGPVRSIKWLQQSLKTYKGTIDGQIGLGTLRAVSEDDNNDALIDRMCDRRMAFLQTLRHWHAFKTGWTKRVKGVRAMGKAMASGKALPKPVFEPTGAARASDQDVTPPPAKAIGDAATGAGGAIGGGALTIKGTVTETMDQLTPFAGYSESVGTFLTYLAVVGAILVAGGLLWRVYAVWKGRKIAEAAA